MMLVAGLLIVLVALFTNVHAASIIVRLLNKPINQTMPCYIHVIVAFTHQILVITAIFGHMFMHME